ncbi:hypothetical protein AKJ09_09001 [Labilithrix luteola]|uniref:Uncharacterized protein n=1 Tax=Labilithrix luteola TaxID=1391654 RepID=A0A0K1Q9C7_9BACT|nr:hypothetical protein [Labilithrix luteola]AKV02338.1 hypothetical protein AKJ09_09001 [Labilithrix luteola]
MTAWDLRAFLRALGATLVGIAVVWLVTAASDEGQLSVGVRAGRTLPLAPLCSAVGVALALGATRVRSETRALEALGRSPSQALVAPVVGAALPSFVFAALIAASSAVDISAFYPRAPRGDSFVYRDGAFESATLGVRVATSDGDARPIDGTSIAPDEGLPRGARSSASLSTALAGAALTLIAARAVLHMSMLDRATRRRRRALALVLVAVTSIATLVAFQAAAAHLLPSAVAAVPSALLLASALFGFRSRYRFPHARGATG